MISPRQSLCNLIMLWLQPTCHFSWNVRSVIRNTRTSASTSTRCTRRPRTRCARSAAGLSTCRVSWEDTRRMFTVTETSKYSCQFYRSLLTSDLISGRITTHMSLWYTTLTLTYIHKTHNLFPLFISSKQSLKVRVINDILIFSAVLITS